MKMGVRVTVVELAGRNGRTAGQKTISADVKAVYMRTKAESSGV